MLQPYRSHCRVVLLDLFAVNRLHTEKAKQGVKHVIKVKVIIVATGSQRRAALTRLPAALDYTVRCQHTILHGELLHKSSLSYVSGDQKCLSHMYILFLLLCYLTFLCIACRIMVNDNVA